MGKRRLAIVAVAASSGLYLLHPSLAMAHAFHEFPYVDEGPVVEAPAVTAGLALGIPAGLIGAVVCSPVAVARAVTQSPDRLWTTTKQCAIAGGTFPGLVGYTIAGFPFYLLKKAFWDFPKRMIAPEAERRDHEPDAEQHPIKNGPVSWLSRCAGSLWT